jgi:Pentapeptide repeats (8 copies)
MKPATDPDSSQAAPGPSGPAEGLLQLFAAGKRDFSGTTLRGVCFDRAILRGAHLDAADLAHASFEGADLAQANLKGAELTDTSFRGAVLERADLTGAMGLLPRQLAGANLRGAKLPDALKEFGDLKRAQQLADSAQKLFLVILAACAYLALAVITTTDPQLLLVSTSAELPIIKTPVPTLGLFWVGPLLLVLSFTYFHLYLQRLWETLAELPAILPDGAALDERVDPWLVTSLIRRRIPRLRETESARAPWLLVQDWLCVCAVWWVTPLALVPVWLRYLMRHDWTLTSIHVGLIVLLLLAACELRWLTTATLRGAGRHQLSWSRSWRTRRYYEWGAIAACAIGVLWAISYAGIEGVTFANRYPTAPSLLKRLFGKSCG